MKPFRAKEQEQLNFQAIEISSQINKQTTPYVLPETTKPSTKIVEFINSHHDLNGQTDQ